MTEKRKWKTALAICTICMARVLGIGSTEAYLTSFDRADNMVSVGENTTEIVEHFPEPEPIPVEENPEYHKEVRVMNAAEGKNGSQVDCYVRLSVGCSHSDIGKAVVFKNLDTENWSRKDDGFYYFKKVLKEGESTTPLFTGFRIDSEKVEKDYLEMISEFELQIYEESVQADGFDNYEDAWASYQNFV